MYNVFDGFCGYCNINLMPFVEKISYYSEQCYQNFLIKHLYLFFPFVYIFWRVSGVGGWNLVATFHMITLRWYEKLLLWLLHLHLQAWEGWFASNSVPEYRVSWMENKNEHWIRRKKLIHNLGKRKSKVAFTKSHTRTHTYNMHISFSQELVS